MSNSELQIGDRLIDVNKSDISPVIVYDISDKKADEYIIEPLNKTVKQYTGCDFDESVILTVFESTLRNAIPDWAFLDGDELKQKIDTKGIKKYAYPINKLTRVNNGFVTGVTINISGVSDPINQDSGAYMYTITFQNEEIYSNAEIVNSETHNLEKVSVIYIGLIDALKWVNEHKEYDGVLIRTENKIAVNQLTGEYDVRNKLDNMLFDTIESYLTELSYRNVNLEPRYKQHDIIDIATETFRNKEKIKQEIES